MHISGPKNEFFHLDSAHRNKLLEGIDSSHRKDLINAIKNKSITPASAEYLSEKIREIKDVTLETTRDKRSPFLRAFDKVALFFGHYTASAANRIANKLILREFDSITAGIDHKYESLIKGHKRDLKIIEQEIQENQGNDQKLEELNDEKAIVESRITELKKDYETEIAKVNIDVERPESRREKISLIKDMQRTFPEIKNYDLTGIEDHSLKEIFEIMQSFASTAESLNDVKNGENRYREALSDLDRLQDRLGGSPVYLGRPTIHDEDEGRTMFGIPMNNVKDWFRMTLEKEWSPRVFWKNVAALFGVSDQTKLSQYEEAYVRIQRFGMLIENKDRFFEMLDKGQTDRYHEMGDIAGLAWHVGDNSPGIEKNYIDLVDRFLTVYYERAKNQGDDALVEYFNVLKGVCFEDRCRYIEEYIAAIESGGVVAELANIVDFNTNVPPDYRELGAEKRGAFFAELEALSNELMREPSSLELREHLQKKGVFNTDFLEEDGTKAKPSFERFHNFAIEQANGPNYLMDNYSNLDFLEAELEIFRASGKTTKEEFINQLQGRLDRFNGVIELAGDEEFSLESAQNFIEQNFLEH